MSKTISKKSFPVLGCAMGLLLTAVSFTAQATNIKVSITVDNSYALFYGTQTAATSFVGSDFNWPTVETYNFNLPSNQFIYIVTASDLSLRRVSSVSSKTSIADTSSTATIRNGKSWLQV